MLIKGALLAVSSFTVLVVACGGAAPPPSETPIASLPPSHVDATKHVATDSNETVSAPSKAKTLSEICAGAKPIEHASLDTFDANEATAASNVNQSRDPQFHDARLLDSQKVGHFGGAGTLRAKSTPYTLADLQALEKKQAWQELLDHAEDVTPSNRTDAWNAIVEHAATGYVEQMTAQGTWEGIAYSEAFVTRYPQLTRSSAFMAKRSAAGTAYAEQCLARAYSGEHCIDTMKAFLKVNGTSARTGFDFGKITRLHMNHYVAVPFFRWALDKQSDAQMCGDEDLSLAVVAGLGLPTEYPNAADARQIGGGACFDKLKDAITKDLDATAGAYYRDNACAVLKAKGAVK